MDIDDDRPNPDAQDGTCRPRLQLSEHFTEEPAVEPYVPPSPDRSATTEHGMGRWLRRWPCKNARREKISHFLTSAENGLALLAAQTS